MRFIAKKGSWGKFAIKASITLVVLWFLSIAFTSKYRIGIDPQQERCLPRYSIFLIDLKDKYLKKGCLYAFSARGMKPFYDDNTRIVKMLMGMPGDTVEINSKHQVMVNGEVVGEGLELARKLQQLESRFHGKSILKVGNYWFMGKSSNSFDSRYWGVVKDEQIIGRAYPLF